MSTRAVARGCLAVVMAAVTLSGCTGLQGGAGLATTSGGQPGISVVPVGARTVAPLIAGTTLQGHALSLRDFSRDVVVINVWGSWCTVCREEAPALEEAYSAYRGKGVQFVGIDTLDETASALAYDSRFGVAYPSLQDPDEALLLRFAAVVPSTDVPSTVIIDREGKIAARIIGGVTEPELDQLLDGLAKEN